ncbi:hypothetical protein PsorP6_016778 [Peronosclerospora sorghi]|uniref:Uncharacterized protein n=1 Tax=Peronosclerospora sorghi TaxID=230839 RepID=A0ACC0WFM1_9STRA|nr:hypothetical protein PsorP6_016778 [Peronosclerospora sorghi]
MASSGDESAIPNSRYSRRSTPRARVKKIAVMETKRTPPRRRVSPRNFQQRYDEKVSDTEKQHETSEMVSENSALDEDQAEDKLKEKTEARQHDDTGLPAQDTQLRRNYLQRIYRQLQSTHPNQDDALIRQVATKIEMEVCQKAVTKKEYTAAMDQEIYKLMQVEIAQAPQSVYTKEDQSFDKGNDQTQVSDDVQSGFSPNQVSQSRSFEYAQALAKAQSQEMSTVGRSSAYSTPRPSMSGGNSFQSLMNNQAQVYGLDGSQPQQQQYNTPNRVSNVRNLQHMGNPYIVTSPMVSPTSQNYGIQSNVGNSSRHNVPRNMMLPPHHFRMQPQYIQQSARSQHRVSSFHEFSAQIQHLDKSVLIELLWNQRNTLAQWQRRAKQHELRLSAQRNSISSLGGSAYQSPYTSPMVGGGNFASPNISAEPGMQRAQVAGNVMPQCSYTQQSHEDSPAYSQAGGNGLNWEENVQAYWNKVRELKFRYAEQLLIAKRALANNSAPPNSVYSIKAQSVMDNIGLVINILDEQPMNAQPRKFDVLTSIERFIQITVVPIVRKVQSSYMTSAHSAAMDSGSFPTAASNSSAHASDTSSSQDAVGTPEQYVGTGTERSNSTSEERSRQFSRSDSVEVNSSSSRCGDESTDCTTRVKDEFLPSDSPIRSGDTSSQNALVRPTSDNTAAVQAERSTEKVSAYEATMVSREQLSAPTSEFRLPTVSEIRPQNSPGGVMKESKVSQSNVDVLNDFTDFPELDFDEESSFVKENNPSNGSRKRGIDDV